MRWAAPGARAALVALTCAVACGGPAAGGGGGVATTPSGPCAPVAPSVAADGTLAGRAGRYELTMVASAGDGVRAAAGALTLRDRPEGMRRLAGSATPLDGFTDLSPGAVGAQSMGRADSEDPSSPGVLVIETDRPTGRSILLRLGSDANRSDRVAFDGASTVLTVQRIDGGGFFGSWTSQTPDTRVTGHFCAIRRDG